MPKLNMPSLSTYIVITNAAFKGETWDHLLFSLNLELSASQSQKCLALWCPEEGVAGDNQPTPGHSISRGENKKHYSDSRVSLHQSKSFKDHIMKQNANLT